MRVRIFEARLVAALLTGLWTLAGALVLLVYQPGGPVDRLVGAAGLVPVAIGMAAVLWPPTARGQRAFALIIWLGLATTLLLVPSIADVVKQLLAGGSQTLLPSAEAAYPWVLALAGTSLFAGFGIARRTLGEHAPRTLRLGRGMVIAVALTLVTGSLFAGVAIANELALRDKPGVASRFGPTRPTAGPPACDARLRAARTAQLTLSLAANVDGRSLGSVEMTGSRSGSDLRWIADVATERSLGQFAAARVGAEAWTKAPGGSWQTVPPQALSDRTIDQRLMDVAFSAGNRAVAEEHGLEYVEGAPARHCRVAIDGALFLAALPEVTWFAAQLDVHRWRGQLDFWVFADGELGQASGSINGDAAGLGVAGLLGNVTVRMTATDRDAAISISPPS